MSDRQYAIGIHGYEEGSYTAGDLAAWERVFDLFDGRDDGAVAAARGRWKLARVAGHTLTYWRQTEAGGWEKAG